MRLFKIFLSALFAASLVGCGTLIPKKVELFQDKVQRFPDQKDREKEIQREAADRAAREARKVVEQGIEEGVSTNILKNANDAAILTDAVSDSIGPPLKRNDGSAQDLVDKLNNATAKLDDRIDNFSDENDTNAGKKIEGTGLIQVSYFAWLGGFLVLLFFGYIALKVISTLGAAANPAVGLGVNAVSLSARSASKAVSQLIKGGQKFKRELDARVADPALKAELTRLFNTSHKEAQDEEVKKAVDHLIKD